MSDPSASTEPGSPPAEASSGSGEESRGNAARALALIVGVLIGMGIGLGIGMGIGSAIFAAQAPDPGRVTRSRWRVPGFNTYEADNLALAVGQNLDLNISLAVGSSVSRWR